MNAGKTADQLAADIQLPPEYAGLPIWQSIMAVWNGRYGPFTRLTWDGSTGTLTHLHPLSPEEHSQKMIALIGGMQTVLDAAKTALSPQRIPMVFWNYAIYFYPMEIQQKRKYCT